MTERWQQIQNKINLQAAETIADPIKLASIYGQLTLERGEPYALHAAILRHIASEMCPATWEWDIVSLIHNPPRLVITCLG